MSTLSTTSTGVPGRPETGNQTTNGTTVDPDYPTNSNTYTSDTSLKLTATVTGSSESYTAEFVYEDDDSQVDNTDSFSTLSPRFSPLGARQFDSAGGCRSACHRNIYSRFTEMQPVAETVGM